MGFKQERLAKNIERHLSRIILLDSKDARLKFVTITGVKLTNDLSFATVYYTILGDKEQQESTAKNLESAKGYLRTELSKALQIRKMPQLIFKYDESIEHGNRIDNILKDLKDE